MVSWVRFLREKEGLPIKYLSLPAAMDSELALLGFASNGTGNQDAFVLVNLGRDKTVSLRIQGSVAGRFAAYRTTEDEKDRYAAIGEFGLERGGFAYTAPGGSVTTFFAVE